jgi:hypothetical protein
MLKIDRILYIIAMVLSFGACAPQLEDTAFYKGQTVTLMASVPNTSTETAKQLPDKQRVSGLDNQPSNLEGAIDLYWNKGDQIEVQVGETATAVFQLMAGEGTPDATFSGQMPADGTEYHVSYPAGYQDSWLQNQNYVPNGFANQLMKMSTKQAGTIDHGFTLSADNALLGLQLTGHQTLGKIVLTNLSNNATYTLHCPGVTLKTEATLFYIVVPEEGWQNGMRVEVWDSEDAIILRKEKTENIDFSKDRALIMPTLTMREPGKRIGIFSVATDKYVSFSQGNLQYIKPTNTWQFANNQYDYLGEMNKKGEHIDLFDWYDTNGNFADWGKHIVQNDVANTWRTLSHTEWKYLLYDRPLATRLLGAATVNGTMALVILPDNWVCPAGLNFVSLYDKPTDWTWDNDIKMYQIKDDTDIYQYNKYDANQWQQMEQAGAVAMPVAGYIDKNSELQEVGSVGRYWSSTHHDTAKGYYISFGVGGGRTIRTQSYVNRDMGHTVRLVHDTIIVTP